MNIVKTIDLFAGPGGLAEGFSSVLDNKKRFFNIKLSIEKDENAHKTLLLRSFCRQFPVNSLPEEYYDVLKGISLKEREELKNKLFDTYKNQAKSAMNEAWRHELGTNLKLVDKKIINALKGEKNWLLIGGPPCQAYSLAGRSRVGGINANDHRVYLYKEYLRIIAVHHPAIFVMENVKGLLSAKVNNEKVFDWILRDLQEPGLVFKGCKTPKYKIYSFVKSPDSYNNEGYPIYSDDKSFLIKSENYKIPQKRHRVILLGLREDINILPETLLENKVMINLKNVISDLPKLRSSINRSFFKYEKENGKNRRIYTKEIDDYKNWLTKVYSFRDEIKKWNGFANKNKNDNKPIFNYGKGAEYIKFKTPSKRNPLYDWYYDENLNGICNSESRSHLLQDLKRYMFSSMFSERYGRFPRMMEFKKHCEELIPDHKSALSGKFADRFRVQLANEPATTITSHISKDGHYFIHYDSQQCRSLTVREAARIQTFPDNYLFCGSRTAQFHQVGNAVPPFLAFQLGLIVKKIFKKL